MGLRGHSFVLFSNWNLSDFFFLSRVVYSVQLFLKNWRLFRNIQSFNLDSGSGKHSSREPTMPHL